MTWLTNRQAVVDRLDIAVTPWDMERVDSAIRSAGESIERDLLSSTREFRPVVAARAYDWPDPDRPQFTWRVWLDADLLQATSIVVGSTAFASTDYELWPYRTGRYRRIDIAQDGDRTFAEATSFQRAVVVTGLWGWSNDETTVLGAISGSINASASSFTATRAPVSGRDRLDVGDVIRADSERMIIVDRDLVDSGDTLGADVALSMAASSVSVTSGSDWAKGERIQVGSELMRIRNVVGDVLLVDRAVGGTRIAEHSTGAAILVERGLTVERGAYGTTADSHVGSVLYRHEPPPQVVALATSEALATLQGDRSGQTEESGSGGGARSTRASGLPAQRQAVVDAFKQKGMFGTVGGGIA